MLLLPLFRLVLLLELSFVYSRSSCNIWSVSQNPCGRAHFFVALHLDEKTNTTEAATTIGL